MKIRKPRHRAGESQAQGPRSCRSLSWGFNHRGHVPVSWSRSVWRGTLLHFAVILVLIVVIALFTHALIQQMGATGRWGSSCVTRDCDTRAASPCGDVTSLWMSQKSNKKAVAIKDVKGAKKRIYKIAWVFYLFIGPMSPKTSWQNSHNLYNGHKLISREQAAPLRRQKWGIKPESKGMLNKHRTYFPLRVIGSHVSVDGRQMLCRLHSLLK